MEASRRNGVGSTALLSIGKKTASILFITEPPSDHDQEIGTPISASKLDVLARYFKPLGFNMEEVAFLAPCPPMTGTNVGTDKREKTFLKSHREEFLAKVAEYDPKVIVPMGKHAAYQVMGQPIVITKARGVVTKSNDFQFPVLPMLGLGYIQVVPGKAVLFETDMKQLAKLKELNWDSTQIKDVLNEIPHEWRTDISDIIALKPKVISFDTETTGLAWYKPEVQPITFQMAYKNAEGDIVSVASVLNNEYAEKHGLTQFSPGEITKLIAQWKQVLEDPSIKKVAHNFKYDHHIARKLGINTKGWYACTMQLSFVVDESMERRALDECVRRWVPQYGGYSDQFDQATDKAKMMDVAPLELLRYGCGDTFVTYLLAQKLVSLGMEDKANWRCFEKIQMPGLIAFAETMETHGMNIDVEKLLDLKDEMEQRRDELQEILTVKTPREIRVKYITDRKPVLNFNSASLLIDLLFTPEGLNLKPRMFTEATKDLPDAEKVPQTGKAHLTYFEENETVQELLEYKRLQKMISTYLGDQEEQTGIFQYIYEGKIHPSYSLSGTVTGRCLAGNTRVYTQFGWVTIYELLEKEKEMTYQVLTHKQRWRNITKFFRCGKQNIISLTLENGATVNCSYKHRLLTYSDEWIEAQDIEVGTVLKYLNIPNELFKTKEMTAHRVTEIEQLDPLDTFDIEVEQDHSFIINGGIISHNSSSRDPNGQNFPKRGKLAKAYRAIFKADPGWTLINADFSQLELRLAAWEACELNMIKVYQEDKDIHSMTAATAMGIPIEEFDALPEDEWEKARTSAKGITFGNIYEMHYTSYPAYAKVNYGLTVTEDEAHEGQNKFFSTWPRLLPWHRNKKNFVRANGYIRALHGALRRFPDVNSIEKWAVRSAERQAINSSVQRMGSDMGIMAIIILHKHLNPETARIIGFVHDALVFQSKKGHEEETASTVRWVMENLPFLAWFNIEPPLPIKADIEIGDNMAEMKKRKDIAPKQPAWFNGW